MTTEGEHDSEHDSDPEGEHETGPLAGGEDDLCVRLIEEIDDTNAILERLRRRPGFRAQIARLLHPRLRGVPGHESPPAGDV